ncbi:alpha/beta hydrolase [Anaerosolibacter sp.]|uniref:alpha/beta hydrolase n=1 Tax=Anaerosolibacter sp. TaxID=1872527 RepID=UPI0039EF6EDE
MFYLLGGISVISLVFLIGAYHFSNLVIQPKTLNDQQVLEMMQEKHAAKLAAVENLSKVEVWLESPFGYKMRGWFYPNGSSQKTIILCHGITMNLLHSIKYFYLFYERGFNVLLYDHRNHGRSGGHFTTLGYYEKQDLAAWVDWVSHRLGSHSIIGIHGESMGAATALQHGAIDHRVRFYIADCSFSDLNALLAFRLKADYRLPPFPWLPISSLITYCRTKAHFQDVSPAATIKAISAPVLFIHGSADTYIPPEMSIEMYREKIGSKDLLLVEGAKHAKSIETAPKTYEEAVDTFLKTVISEQI